MQQYFANKYSGIESTPFLTSAILAFVGKSNVHHTYQFPFYGMSIDIQKEYAEEWVDDELYAQVVDQIVEDCEQGGIGYFENTATEIKQSLVDLDVYVHEIWPGIPEMNDVDLVEAFMETVDLYTSKIGIGAVTFIYEAILSKRLHESIANRYPEYANQIIQKELHTDHVSFMTVHEQDLAKIAGMESNERDAAMQAHLDKWYYMDANYNRAPVYTIDSLQKKCDLLNTNIHSKAEHIVDIPEYSLSNTEQTIIQLFKVTTVIRDVRKQVNMIGSFIMDRFLEEAVKRRNVDITVARRMHWNEFARLLEDDSFVDELAERTYTSYILDIDGVEHYFDYQSLNEKEQSDQQVLSGTPASSGVAEGPVRIIRGSTEFDSFNEGDILVTSMTRPEFVPIMKKAAAIITDEGGLTSHAAIVSRELGIPCILGTRTATQVLKTGQHIRVDAIKGVIIHIKHN